MVGSLDIEEKEFRVPNEVPVDLWSTSMVFAKGHQIRISVSSGNYPRCEKNLNTGFDPEGDETGIIAKNNVFMGGSYPSRIILPVVKSQPIPKG